MKLAGCSKSLNKSSEIGQVYAEAYIWGICISPATARLYRVVKKLTNATRYNGAATRGDILNRTEKIKDDKQFPKLDSLENNSKN